MSREDITFAQDLRDSWQTELSEIEEDMDNTFESFECELNTFENETFE